jgi:FdhE protein
MKTSVVSKEYMKFQESIIKLQEQWTASLNPERIQPDISQTAVASGVPFAAQTVFTLDFPLLQTWIEELANLLADHKPELENQVTRVISFLDEYTANRWMEEALMINHVYFQHFADEHQVETWIPQFIAETLFRPYLQTLAKKTENKISHAAAGCGCPVCGEPVRFGQLEGKGQKVLYCPRCYASWLDKKLSCSHCGNEDYQTMKYLTIEGKPTEQIHVCEECKGYTKIIDTRQFIEKPSPQLLDLKTIHLDYIAQENGYSMVGMKK